MSFSIVFNQKKAVGYTKVVVPNSEKKMKHRIWQKVNSTQTSATVLD